MARFFAGQSLCLVLAFAAVVIALPVVLNRAAPLLLQPLARLRPSLRLGIDPGFDLLHGWHVEAWRLMDDRSCDLIEAVASKLRTRRIRSAQQQPTQPVAWSLRAVQALFTLPEVALPRFGFGLCRMPAKDDNILEPLGAISQPLGDSFAAGILIKASKTVLVHAHAQPGEQALVAHLVT